MDPHATLVEFLRAVLEGDGAEIREHADSLATWIEQGGYRPNTTPAIHALFQMGGSTND